MRNGTAHRRNVGGHHGRIRPEEQVRSLPVPSDGRLYGRLRCRVVLVGLCALSGVAVAQTPARAATPRPVRAVRASSARVVFTQPAALTVDQLQTMLANVVGTPILISCDEPGVPSPLDGHTLDAQDDGEVFYLADGTIGNVVHVSTLECSNAEQANRVRDQYPPAFFVYQNKRIDSVSGPAFLILLHESFHVALQSRDEGVVECSALRNSWPLVRQLNLPAFAASMMLQGMAWRHSWFPAPYRTVC